MAVICVEGTEILVDNDDLPLVSHLEWYKGVSLKRQTGRWEAYIMSGGRKRHLGYFDTEVEAARAYDLAAIDLWGEFARPNFTTDS